MTSKPKLNQPDVETTTTIPNITIEKEKNLELAKQLGIDLTSLTPQPSKLEQCIKEWEDRNFIVENDKLYIFLNHMQHNLSIVIVKNEIKYHVFYGYISLELNELLTQTLKTLEVENNAK